MPADKCVIADTDALGRRARKGPRGGTLASLAVGESARIVAVGGERGAGNRATLIQPWYSLLTMEAA